MAPAVQTALVQTTVLNFTSEGGLHGKNVCLFIDFYFTYHLHELKGKFIGETVAILHTRHCTACSNWTVLRGRMD